MKKRYVNLLPKISSSGKLTAAISSFIKWNLLLIPIFTILLPISIFSQIYFSSVEKKNKDNLTSFKNFVTTNSETDRKITFFVQRYALLKKYIADDARGYTYYNHINKILAPIVGIKLSSFTVDNKRSTSFVVDFDTNEQALAFITYVETPEFLSNFETITLNSIKLTKQTVEPTTEPTMSSVLIPEVTTASLIPLEEPILEQGAPEEPQVQGESTEISNKSFQLTGKFKAIP